MIRVTIDLAAPTSRAAHTVGRMDIVNREDGTEETGNYDVFVDGREFVLAGFPRKEGAYALVYEALKVFLEKP